MKLTTVLAYKGAVNKAAQTDKVMRKDAFERIISWRGAFISSLMSQVIDSKWSLMDA